MKNKYPKKYFLGVDIGATKTRYALADQTGRVIQVISDPGSSHEFCGLETAGKILKDGLNRITHDNGLSLAELEFVYFGAAGADTQEDFLQLRDLYGKILPETSFDFENDGLIALKSGTLDGVGMVITCGTGNTNFAANKKGFVKRIGGLTPYAGDVLGAVNIAGMVCSATVRSEDGRDYPSLLARVLPEKLRVPSVKDLSNVPLSPENVQIILEVLFDCASEGDGKSLEITWIMVKETLDIVEQFHAAIFEEGEPFKLVLEGSVFKQQFAPFMRMLKLALENRYRARIIVPDWEPVAGSLLLAFDSSGMALHDSIIQNIITGCKL
jgi:N-acetylglucosamine kinase-like BadF-type ATPase